MSYRTSRHQANHAAFSLGRRRQAKRSQAILEALEKRRLLSGYSGYTFTLTAQSGTNQAAINLANGIYLQDIINGTTLLSNSQVTNHTLTLGDTLILPDGYDYDMGGIKALNLPNLGAAATATESSGAVTSLSLTFAPAGGYSGSPTVSIFGGGGSGASGTVTYNSTSGTVTGISLTNGGSGYTAAPTVAIQGGAETLTIESGGFNAGDISGRFNAASDVPYDAQISSGNVNGIVQTVLSDSYNHSGAPQNYSFDGIEICMDAATDLSQVPLVLVGLAGSTQDYDQLVPSNFTFNQDYIHGGVLGETTDDLSTAKLNTDERGGMALNANYVTVENSQISDISEPLDTGIQATGIYAANALGNFTINNNYLEATGEDMIFGGAAIYLPSPAQPTNISITNNYITKNPAWNPYLPQYAGVPTGVCDNIEFKTAINVTISHNVIENDWYAEDSMWGEAINISNIDSGANPWTDTADFTITDNVIRNVGMIIDIGGGDGASGYYTTGGLSADGNNPSEITHDVTFSNNLAYNIGGFQWGRPQGQSAILMSTGQGPAQNITIDNNTYFGADAYLEQYTSNLAVSGLLTSNFVFQNNVVDESTEGLTSDGLGQDITGLNSTHFDTLTITNPGSGYTYSTNGFAVTISGGGGSGAAATAYVWPATVVGPNGSEPCPLAGELEYIQVTNCGTGYTSAPTVTISGDGGSGATATAIAESNGQIHSYTFTHNLIIGGSQSNYPVTNATTINYFPTSENAVEMMDVAGDEYGILSTSPYYTDGTGGSIPGVNMSGFVGTGGDTPWNPADVNNSLQNYYKFNEGSGSTAHDNGLGTHENGTINGTYAWSTTGPAGGGISFTGSTSGNVSVANFTADASFTFAAWVKPTNFSATQYIASTKNSSSVSAFSLSLNTSGKLVATGTTGSVTASTALAAGQWALVSVTYSSGTLTLYVNGANVGSATSATTTTGTTTLYIGGNQGSVSSFNGTLDEVRYYSTSLAQTMSVIGNTNLGLAGGTGYSTNTAGFAVTFSGGGGSGAAATAYANNGQGSITSIIMSNNGSGYTSAPTMSFGATGSGASDTAIMSVSPMAYLYAQYGPRFLPAYMDESLIINGTGGTFDTAAISPDETLPSSSFAWSCVNYPDALDISPPTSSNWDTQNPAIVFHGAGRYVFQCVVTDSLGQSATLYLPFTVEAVVGPTQPVSPASVDLGPGGTQQFTVNGSSIASLGNTLSDQFGNTMPSSGWYWSVVDGDNPGTITTGGFYTASTNLVSIVKGAQLLYATPDGVSYLESYASVTVVDLNTPSAPATITVTPGVSNSNVITWTAPPGGGETGYYVYQSTDGTYDGNLIYSSTNLSTLSFTDNAANDPTYAPVPGGTYYYYAEAFNNANGGGPNTAELGIVTGAPAAPSNIVATPGVNSVALTWTNSAGTNAAGWEVWRSTVDTSYSTMFYTEVASNLTSSANNWTDNGVSAGTTYYYVIESYNAYTSLPNVPVSATPYAPSTLSAYEGFNYTTTGGSGWNGVTNSSAVGFASNWSINYTNEASIVSGLTYGSGTSALASAGNALNLVTSPVDDLTSATQTLSTTVGTSGSTFWFSYLLNATGAGSRLTIGETSGTGSGGVAFWWTSNDLSIGVETSTGDWILKNGYSSMASNTTYFVVGEITYNSTSPVVTLYVDPVPTGVDGSGPTGEIFSTTEVVPSGDGTLGPTNQLMLSDGNVSYTSTFDEVRVGTGYSAVAPLNTPAAPTSVVATPSTSAASVVALSWSESSSGSIDYNIQRSTSGTGNWTTVATAVTSSSYTDSSASANTTYYYEVDAYYAPSGTPSAWSANSNEALTIPAAPTGLAAVPGTSTISLKWSDPSSTTNITGYHIWRSTNDSSWGSTPYGTASGANATSFTDTSVGSGTSGGVSYYYEVTAYDTTGNSAADAISGGLASGVANVYAYEGFNYTTTGGSGWSGGNTGLGFAGNWTVTGTGANIVSGLTYSSGTSSLTTSGNALSLSNDNGTATQTLSQSVGTSGSTLWVSCLINDSGASAAQYLQIGSGSTTGNVQFGWYSGDIRLEMTTNNNTFYDPSLYVATANTTYFLVAEIQYLTASPVVTLYIDPTPNSANGSTPSGAVDTITKTVASTAGSFSPTTALSLPDGGVAAVTWDEIRLGATYNSVAPDPMISSSSSSGKSSSRRRVSPFLATASKGQNAPSEVVTRPSNVDTYSFYPSSGGVWQFTGGNADNSLLAANSGDFKNAWVGLFN